ncbi:MAG: NAD-dependent epimerase/dehydratase family protein [Limisphaerales bacterium]
MRAFVTGATGFLGAALVHRLVGAGVPVAILRRSTSSDWRLHQLPGSVIQIQGDLANPVGFKDTLATFRPDTCFHMAWHGVASRHRNDLSQAYANVESTLRLVELAADVGCQTWIGAGSQAEYGPQEGAINEDAPTRPTTLYGAAKLATYHLAGRAVELLGMRFAWLRVFSTYGPGDNPEWMIPSLIRALLARERPELTEGRQRWDYLFVRDAAEAFAAVASTPEARGLYNLGSGEAIPLREIVALVRDQIDPALPLGFGAIPYRPDQVMWLQADCRRLKQATNWAPLFSLSEGLRETIAWHKSVAK